MTTHNVSVYAIYLVNSTYSDKYLFVYISLTRYPFIHPPNTSVNCKSVTNFRSENSTLSQNKIYQLQCTTYIVNLIISKLFQSLISIKTNRSYVEFQNSAHPSIFVNNFPWYLFRAISLLFGPLLLSFSTLATVAFSGSFFLFYRSRGRICAFCGCFYQILTIVISVSNR